MFHVTKYHKAIFDCVENGTGNILISAVAGSGKTSTLIELLSYIKPYEEVLFAAFNKHIVEELKKRIGSKRNKTKIETIHAIGNSILFKNLKNITLNVDKNKETFDVIVDYNKNRNYTIFKNKYHGLTNQFLHAITSLNIFIPPDNPEYINEILKLCDLARYDLYKSFNDILDLCFKHVLSLNVDDCKLAYTILKLSEKNLMEIDFADMIYLPVVHNMPFPKYDFVITDEAQDLSKCQKEIIIRSCKIDGRMIFSGDEFQNIYGFSGADEASYEEICRIPNTIKLPLHHSYRCPKEIVKEAQIWVPHIKAFKTAKDGVLNREGLLKDIRPGDMVLCRNLYPLIKLHLDYSIKGIKSHIVGEDIGADLKKLIDQTEQKTIKDTLKILYKKLDDIKKHLMEVEKIPEDVVIEKMMYYSFLEKIKIIEMLSVDKTTLIDVYREIDMMFKDKKHKDDIILSTIHRAKGLENNRVHIICMDLMPSLFAVLAWQRKQEENLRYVAYTRSKEYLGFIQDYDYRIDLEIKS